MKHKHAERIIAWANGAKIQYYSKTGHKVWVDCPSPTWDMGNEYRIKPKKPDAHQYYFFKRGSKKSTSSPYEANVMLTFDGETDKLKAVSLVTKKVDE